MPGGRRDARRSAQSRVFYSFVTACRASKLAIRSHVKYWMMLIMQRRAALLTKYGANMGKVIRFIPRSEHERARLIQEARAVYDSIFPTADPVSEQQDRRS